MATLDELQKKWEELLTESEELNDDDRSAFLDGVIGDAESQFEDPDDEDDDETDDSDDSDADDENVEDTEG